VDDYTDVVKCLVDTHYSGVTRYTTSTFLRMKLGDALKQRDVAPHIHESSAEAKRALKRDRTPAEPRPRFQSHDDVSVVRL
jgi:propionate CoA-transferase